MHPTEHWPQFGEQLSTNSASWSVDLWEFCIWPPLLENHNSPRNTRGGSRETYLTLFNLMFLKLFAHATFVSLPFSQGTGIQWNRLWESLLEGLWSGLGDSWRPAGLLAVCSFVFFLYQLYVYIYVYISLPIFYSYTVTKLPSFCFSLFLSNSLPTNLLSLLIFCSLLQK